MTFRDQFSRFAHFYDFIIKNPIEDILELIDPQKNDIILDLGGGTGQVAKHLVKYAKETVIVDPSVSMIEKANKKSTKIKTTLGVAEKIPYPDNYFDKVLIYDALHHMQEPITGLKEAIRVLKPDGKLIIGEIDPRSIGGKLLLLFEKVFYIYGTYYSPFELTKILKEMNWRITNYRKTSPITYLGTFSNHK
ncbi:MAG: methyltransferase domain-containing protein [Candidatus Heimdallarchaeota archaeon]|nr:methyltransferase domain-containing protein [Candidatus Heimdallarchaeota archaeon]MCK5049986.1 methyltransferase domain-containing protein [Candidatus Heimdallarchaeota archaeon]